MLRGTIIPGPPQFLNANERTKCLCIANFVLLQCFIIILTGITVVRCMWTPNLISFDPYKLASIMYLYDKEICVTTTKEVKEVQNLKLSTDTRGYNVLPIRWEPAIMTVSERVSYKTRNYIMLSMCFHVVWAFLTIVFRYVVKSNKSSRFLGYALNIYFVSFIFITSFDLSMAIVYVTHIKKALTKGMIVRHSGWSVELNIHNYEAFAGYLPLVAAACWMRGLIILALNIYSCKTLNDIRFRKRKKSVLTKMNYLSQKPFPNALEEEMMSSKTLYFRAGEFKPYVKKLKF